MFGKSKELEELYQIRQAKDSMHTILCPACDKEMLKVYIPELGFNIDICVDGCGGIFFDNKELDKLKAPTTDVSQILEIVKNKTYPKMDETLIRRCGSCGSNMLKIGAGNSKVQIDVCPNCNGKFLDNGELEQIRDSYIGAYEKSLIEYALLNPKSFSIVCSEAIKATMK